jgi:hypothetical protein
VTASEHNSASGPPTIPAIAARTHHPLSSDVDNFTFVAYVVQQRRLRSGVSDKERITRSTGLWTLLELDSEIRMALQSCGLEQEELGDTLGIDRGWDIYQTPGPSDGETPELEDDFADAVRTHLAQRRKQEPIGMAEIALAILVSARDEARGLLGERLRKLEVDIEAAISAVNRLVLSGPESTSPLDLRDFSQSVRQTRTELGGSSTVTPSQIAESLQRSHPGYGRGTFKGIQLRLSQGPAASVDEWLRRVRALYDLSQVKGTRHKVIDGELTLLGLARLDTSLAGSLEADDFLKTLTDDAEVSPRPFKGDRTEWTPDAPAEVDLLGRERLAEALAKRVDLLAAPDSLWQGSFLVHVDGPWGAGKSTLFTFLERQLADRFLVVTVNAWRDQRVGVPWWTLLSALRRAVAEQARWYEKPIVWFGGFADRIRASWVPFAAALLVLVAAVVGIATLTDIDLTTGAQTADSILKIVSLGSVAFAGLVAAARYFLPGSGRSAKSFVETNENPMEEVTRLFGRTLGRAKHPVVLLVDDLDRCDGDYVVEFLEVVQTLVRDAPRATRARSANVTNRRLSGAKDRTVRGPYAFIAADGQWIRSSYENHYEAFGDTTVPGRPLGYLFLEKIFQLHIRLPTITPHTQESFLTSLLIGQEPQAVRESSEQDLIAASRAAVRDAVGERDVLHAAQQATAIQDPAARRDVLGDAAVRFSDRAIERATEHELARFGKFLEPNPRNMRLFVNTYGVLRSLRTLEEVFVPTGPLALWTVIEIRWPLLADQLRKHPEAVSPAEDIDRVSEDIRSLLEDGEVGQVLRDSESGPLTADLVRQCSGG